MTSRWISVHAFYASSADPMLVDCVRPLVATLRQRGLLERFFFVKYWMEGPHVRLRLLPVSGAQDEVRRVTGQELSAFLRQRPALYELNQPALAPVYKRLFIAEYGEERWNEVYGADGQMPLRATNSLHYTDYEPEYDRYGGPAGIEVAEWHFEYSSDLVLQLLATTNVHVKTVMLGLSTQLCLAMCYALLDSDASVADFFARYRGYWEAAYAVEPGEGHARFEKAYERLKPRLSERLDVLRAGVRGHEGAALTPLLHGWIAHVRELRERLTTLVAERRLLLRRPGSAREVTVLEDPAVAFQILIGSYLHMTNNRLGVTIRDEIYLAYLLEHAAREVLAQPEPAGLIR